MFLTIGLMSGTSMDGIDAALLRTDGEAVVESLGKFSLTYPPEFKTLLHAAQYCVKATEGNLPQAKENYERFGVRKYLEDALHVLPTNIDESLSKLQRYAAEQIGVEGPLTFDAVITHSTRLHAQAVERLLEQTGLAANQIDVVGYHGQAFYHQPNRGISIVLGEGQLLADTIGIAAVDDFRRQDVEAGGQGAPFAPLYHQALAQRDGFVPCAVVNCGGISNITLIRDNKLESLIGFDCGPGNGLIDRFVRQRTSGAEVIDRDGHYGLKGQINETVLAALREKSITKDGQNYFDIVPPKSLDFGDLQLIDELENLSLEDGCATLEAFTAECIVASLDLLELENAPRTWVLAGGGWNNPVICRELTTKLQQRIGEEVRVQQADEVGWDNQALEAEIFAYFAVRSLQGKPLSVPGTTRVPRPLTGGTPHVPATGAKDEVIGLLAARADATRPAAPQ